MPSMLTSALHPCRIAGPLACFALVATLLMAPVAADDNLDDNRQRLQQLRERIDEAKAALAEDRSREDEVTGELRRLEERIGALTSKLERLDEEVTKTEERVESLRADYEAASERLATQRRFLRRQIRAAYARGRESYLRLLLNQEDPGTVDRVMVYYDYFNDARSERIRQAVADLEELNNIRTRLDVELARLDNLRADRRQRLEALQAQREEREQLLARLRERIGERDQRLERLRNDAAQLSDLVGRLRDQLSDIPDAPDDAKPFDSLRGELPWPLDGEVTGDYGSRRATGVDWNGVLIRAEPGAPVEAVARGRVVFADWLRGLGLLIIIDHGDGYMTLYGHNQSLYSEAGDWVAAGETVATVGASGGRDEAALYFELRSQGRPVDPNSWLTTASPGGR